MTVLSVNLNKIALLRNQRDLNLPDVLRFGKICLDAGAHGLTVHPRPDQRHAKPRDAFELADLIRAESVARPGLELDIPQIERVPATGADRIELYTEPYAKAWGTANLDAMTQLYAQAARRAQALGLGVNAGHDLNLHNLGHLCRHVPGILEVSIGHALTAEALEMGMSATVAAYVKVLNEAPG
ncbi:MAG: pyridoxine 5'-phosphate synthase [Betaproteobacteria bacterium]|nr:pyridoxine 5'-phosphate synthase [Betaproteobacteria bacterium]